MTIRKIHKHINIFSTYKLNYKKQAYFSQILYNKTAIAGEKGFLFMLAISKHLSL